MRLLNQPVLPVMALLLYTPAQLLFGGVFTSALANRLGGLGDSFLVAQPAGDAFSVGNNDFGQLGLSIKNASVNFPLHVKGADGVLDNVVGVCAGTLHACVRRGNQVACSGNGQQNGQVSGMPSNVFINVPVPDEASGVSNILCGASATFALNNVTGQAWAWGANTNGMLGLGSNDHAYSPKLIPAFDVDNKVVQIDSGTNHACFLTEAGSVLCAGKNENGVLGINLDDSNHRVNVTIAVVFPDEASTTFTSVSCGYVHTCASDSVGRVWCWGSNENGQQAMDYGSLIVLQPTLIPGVQDVKFVWMGRHNVFSVLQNGTAQAWGRDYYGLFGGMTVPFQQRTPMLFGRGVGGIQELLRRLHFDAAE